VLAALLVLLGALGALSYKFVLPWWKQKPPPPSGKELQVHVLDVGPGDGDAILIVSPEGKTVLVDAGDAGKGKAAVLDALKRYNVDHLDFFVATHAHPDHIGGAAEVLRAVKAAVVLHNNFLPPEMTAAEEAKKAADANRQQGDKRQAVRKRQPPPPPVRKGGGKSLELPTTKTYNDFKSAVEESGAEFRAAEPGQKYDLGGGAFLTVLAPIQPFFTKEQMSAGGNEPNANSIVLRLDYGDFSMLLAGDAEAQTEQRMLSKSADVAAKVLKVAHHGSKYATGEDFIKRVQPEVAIISDGEYNRYGHPAQILLDRLKAVNARVYRTDLQGEITITTTGKVKDGKLYEVKPGKEAKSDVWTGREAQKDDSARSGFVAYGDFGPPPRPPKEKTPKSK
jgi:beta-lactamase superfamily II metal-dependent hydrolase